MTKSPCEGLWRLGGGEIGENLPPVFVWWRDFAARFITALRHQPMDKHETGIAATAMIAPPTPAELASLALTAPIMEGAEYLGPEILSALWAAMTTAFGKAYSEAPRRRGKGGSRAS